MKLLIAAVLGAFLGAWLAVERGGPFATPEALDPRRWNVIVPGMDMNVVQHAGRGTAVMGGAIVLTPHVFQRADIVTPRDTRPVGRVSLTLAADSGPLSFRLRDPSRMVFYRITPDTVSVGPKSVPYAAPLTLHVQGGRVRLGAVELGAIGAATLELSADDAPVRITQLEVTDTSGGVFIDEDPARSWRGSSPIFVGAALGALAGLVVAASGLGGVVALVIPAWVLSRPPDAWLAWIERLYLVRWGPTDLARLALALSGVPLVVLALARSGLVLPRRSRAPAWGAWGVVSASATLLASRELTGVSWVLAPLGLGFLLAPLLLSREGYESAGLLARDLPAHAFVMVFGWGAGILPAVIWRLILISAGAGLLARRSPRAAVDALFLMTLAVLPAAELAARATWLDTAWDINRLDDTGPVTEFWSARCGTAPRTIVYLGGSSTGGAYQLLGEPEAFFPARAHALLCASRSVHTVNLGGSGRDSFLFSRNTDAILAWSPAVAVVYLGVNDLLTQDNPLTRAEREALELQRSSSERFVAELAGHSRLLTGVTLFLRPAVDLAVPVVADVPLPDAEANLRRIITEVRAVGGGVLLVPEHAEAETARQIAGYAALEARLAEELDGVAFLDAGVRLAGKDGVLVDRNHLSRAGATALAAELQPAIEGLLDGSLR